MSMRNFKIEIGDTAEPSQCECCGNTTLSSHGFLYEEGEARGLYFAQWTEGHPERGLLLTVSLGSWGEGSTPAQRRSIAFRCQMPPAGTAVRPVAPDESPFHGEEMLGPMLPPEGFSDEAIVLFHSAASFVLNSDVNIRSWRDALRS